MDTDKNIVFIACPDADKSLVSYVVDHLHCDVDHYNSSELKGRIYLQADCLGLSLVEDDRIVRGDFSTMLQRVAPNNLNGEMLVKAARFKNDCRPSVIVDATAGLGQDSFLLAAAGHKVIMYEKNPIIGLLLYDAIVRGKSDQRLRPILEKMELHIEDSIRGMKQLTGQLDIVFLDPMFPKRNKSGLVKKKFQLLHNLEQPNQNIFSVIAVERRINFYIFPNSTKQLLQQCCSGFGVTVFNLIIFSCQPPRFGNLL